MKKFFILFILVHIFISISSQTYNVYYDESGNPIRLLVYNESEREQYQLDGLSPNGQFDFTFDGQDYSLDLKSFGKPDRQREPNETNYSMDYIEPGLSPEGDLINTMEYSLDGSLLAIVCKHSNNVFFYNAVSWKIEAIVNVCTGPVDIAFTDEQAFVACAISEEVTVLNLNDFSIENTFSVEQEETLNQIEVKSDGSLVILGYFSFLNGSVAAYVPKKGDEVYYTKAPQVHRYSHVGQAKGRIVHISSKFILSPNDEIFIAPNTSGHDPTIYDANTGEVLWWITPESYRGVLFSPGGDSVLVLTYESSDTHNFTLWHLDCENMEVIDTIRSNNNDLITNSSLAYSADRTKVLAANSFKDIFYYYDLQKRTCTHIEEPYFMGASWLFNAPGENIALSYTIGNFRVFNMETGEIGEHISEEYNMDLIGVVSPDSKKFIIQNETGRPMRWSPIDEVFNVYDITDYENIVKDTAIVLGVLPEADGTTSAVLSNDGKKLFATNYLSANFSIIDYETGTLDTILQDKSFQSIKTIPNSNLIILFDHPTEKIQLFDPLKNQVKAEFAAELSEIYISPDGEYMYFWKADIYWGQITKIKLDGENTHIVEYEVFPVHYKTFLTWYIFDYGFSESKSPKPGFSPDGKYFIYGDKDEETGTALIGIFNTELMEVVALLPFDYGGYVFGAVFTDDGKRAVVLNISEDEDVGKPIIYLDDEDSYIESVVENITDSYSGEYNEKDGMFYILLLYNHVLIVDPLTGEVVEKISTDVNENWQMVLDDQNKPIIRQFKNLLYDGNYYPFPGFSSPFYYHNGLNLCITPSPGPDAISVFNPLTVSTEYFPKTNVEFDVKIGPNPATDRIVISASQNIQRVEIFDLNGKQVYGANFNNTKTTIPVESLKDGVYIVRVANGNNYHSKKVVLASKK